MVIHTVENEVVVLFAVPIDVRPAAAGGVVAVVKARRIRRDGARRKQRQLNVVARRQWQPVGRRGVNDGVDLGGFCLQNRGGARDFDSFSNLTHLHLHVDASGLVKNERQRRMYCRLKSRCCYPDAVISDGNTCEVVGTCVVSLRGPDDPPLGVGCRNGCIFDRRSTWIANRSYDTRRHLLAHCRFHNGKSDCQQKSETNFHRLSHQKTSGEDALHDTRPHNVVNHSGSMLYSTTDVTVKKKMRRSQFFYNSLRSSSDMVAKITPQPPAKNGIRRAPDHKIME